MTPIEPISFYNSDWRAYIYTLANNLSPSEKIQVARGASAREKLLMENFPHYHAWLLLNLQAGEWLLDWKLGPINGHNWEFVLVLDTGAHQQFQAAWGEADAAA